MSDFAARISALSPEKQAILSKRLQAQASATEQMIRVEQTESIVALSFAEEQLWFLHQMDTHSGAYNMPLAIELRGELCLQSLKQALNHLVSRHSLLRSEYVSVEGRPWRRVLPGIHLDLACESISTDDADNSLHQWVEAAVRAPFDLNHGPLIRAGLARLGSDHQVLVVVLHHIICDASSLAILIRELIACYKHSAFGDLLELPFLPVGYGDFAAWQRRSLVGAELEREIAYWESQLAGVSENPGLPADKVRSLPHSPQYACLTEEPDSEFMLPYKSLLVRESQTSFVGYLTALIVTLHAFSGSRDIVVGCPVTGRVRNEVRNVIGLFANLHILRVRLPGDPSFQWILSEVRRVVSEVRDHHQVPYTKVIERLPRNPRRSLFQASFTYDDEFAELPRVQGLEIAPIRVDPAAPMYELDLNVSEAGGKFLLDWQYDAAVFEASTISRLARYFRQITARVVASPGIVLSEIVAELSELEERQKSEEIERRAQALSKKLMRSKRKPLKLNDGEKRSA